MIRALTIVKFDRDDYGDADVEIELVDVDGRPVLQIEVKEGLLIGRSSETPRVLVTVTNTRPNVKMEVETR